MKKGKPMPSSSPSSSSKHRGLGRGLDDLIKGGIQKKPAPAAPAKPAPSKGTAKPAPAMPHRADMRPYRSRG